MRDPHLDNSLLICRCEEVTLQELAQQFADGAMTPEEIKRYTRITMGPCQGRVCRQVFLRVWQNLIDGSGFDSTVATISPLAGMGAADLPLPFGARLPGYRPPVRAVTVGEIAALDAPRTPSRPPEREPGQGGLP